MHTMSDYDIMKVILQELPNVEVDRLPEVLNAINRINTDYQYRVHLSQKPAIQLRLENGSTYRLDDAITSRRLAVETMSESYDVVGWEIEASESQDPDAE